MIFGRRRLAGELDPPPIAERDAESVEVLRVWARPGRPQELVLQTTWADAGAWGMLLVDVARHVSRAYGTDGQDPEVVLARIREVFDAEWDSPTDQPRELEAGD